MKPPFSFKNRSKSKSGRVIGWRGLMSLMAVALVAWCVGFVIFVHHLPKASDQTLGEAGSHPSANPSANPSADGIVVLTGGAQRLKTGLSLLEAGVAPKLFVSGVHRGVDVTALLRVSRQTPDRVSCCIELGHEASDTRENAIESAEWATSGGYQSIILVTADYHMPRATLEFALLAPELTVYPHPVFAGNVKTEEWYRFPGTAAFIAGEYSKSLVTLLRYSLFVITRSALATLGEMMFAVGLDTSDEQGKFGGGKVLSGNGVA